MSRRTHSTAPRKRSERLAIMLASCAMAGVFALTLTPKGAFGLLSASPAQAHGATGFETHPER